MKDNTNVLLAIKCMVYNHAPFLRQCLDGFVMQKTSFRFVAIVHDDCSTDNSVDIIREYADKYPNIICPIFESVNQFDKPDGTLGRIMNNACDSTGAKYIAICEGDDYWTDPLKLQKQVDYLEEHEEYIMCCHRNSIFFEDEKRIEGKDQWERIIIHGQKGIELNSENYFQIGTLPQVLTVVFRNGVLEKSEWYNKVKPRSRYDQTMMYAFVEMGKIWVMNENMGVYRRHVKGVATSLSQVQAAEKMYYTWHDVYEVHPNANTKTLYLSSLQQYMYCLVKHEGLFWGKTERRLMKEYNALNEPIKNRIRLQMRLVKGGLLYFIGGLKRSSDEA